MISREYSPLCFVCLVCRAIRLVDTLQNEGVVIGVWYFERETVGLFRGEARFCKENAIKGFEIAVKITQNQPKFWVSSKIFRTFEQIINH